MNKLEQFEANIQKLSEMAAHFEERGDRCGLGAPKVFKITHGEARTWLLHERESVSIVKAYVSPGATFPVHAHETREIIILFEGGATYESGDVTKVMKPGDCVSVIPGKPHQIRAHEEGAWFSVTTVPREEGLTDAR